MLIANQSAGHPPTPQGAGKGAGSELSQAPPSLPIQKEDKFLVFNMKFIHDLSPEGHQHLIAVCEELTEKFPRAKDNHYVCCNLDEPYAEAIWQVILEGERKKLKENHP